jgi:hypothetical protein
MQRIEISSANSAKGMIVDALTSDRYSPRNPKINFEEAGLHLESA